MESLAQKKCMPCRGGITPLTQEEIEPFLKQVKGWRCVDGHHIEKSFLFKDFAQGLRFVNKVGAIAEEEGHHPDIYLAWGKVEVKIWTHKIDGLWESDFILASKIDQKCTSIPTHTST